MFSPSELRTQVVQAVSALAPETLTGTQAAAMVAEFATIEKAAATGRLFAAVRVAQTDAWRGQGHASAADWLAAQAGISVYEANQQLGTARKAQRLPKTKKAMTKGKLSPGQANSVTDGASADPHAEDELLDTAQRDTAAKLREKAAKIKAAATDAATRDRRIRTQRSVRTHTDAEGAFNLHLRGPAADGARLVAMMRPYEELQFQQGRTAGVRDSFDNRSYDAFFTMLADLAHKAMSNAAGQGGAAVGNDSGNPAPPEPGQPSPATAPDAAHDSQGHGDVGPHARRGVARPDEARPSRPLDFPPWGGQGAPAGGGARWGPDPGFDLPLRLPGGNNIKVIVRIDHSALARGFTVAGETCDIAGLGPISVTTAKDLMADAFVAAIITKGRDVHTVAHMGRGLNAHQRTAIEWTGTACTNLACNRTVATQIDHRVPYGTNPETKLDNQDPLCPGCHNLKTHRGWQLEPGVGRRRFLAPDQSIGLPAGQGRPEDRGRFPMGAGACR